MMHAPDIRPKVKAAVLVAGLALLVTGCTLAPFEELWQRYGFGQPEVSRLQPAAVRAAIKLPLPVRPRPEGAALVLELPAPEADRQAREHRFAMALVNEGPTVRAEGLPTADPGYNWYLFKLTPSAEDELARTQAEYLEPTPRAIDTGAILVINEFQNTTAGQEVSRSVWVYLSDDRGFFPLVRDERLTVGKDGKVHR